MPSDQSNVSMDINPKIEPYVQAMLGASGLSTFDAVTSVLFAITTHIDLDYYPTLVLLGPRGTGKSEAMKQLFPMCKGAKPIGGTTEAAQKKELVAVRTAFFDEADIIDSTSGLTDLYTKRYSRQTGTVMVNAKGDYGKWELKPFDIFGATVMAKRTPIADVALRSRAVIIRTAYHPPESWTISSIKDISGIASELADKVRQRIEEIGGIDRVQQTWNPLYVLAEQLGMTDWGKEAFNIIAREAEALAGGQGYEPADAILQAIDILSRDEVNSKRTDKSVKTSEVVRVVKDEFALVLKPNQIKEEAEARGFQTSTLHGYPVIKVKKDLLNELLPEEG